MKRLVKVAAALFLGTQIAGWLPVSAEEPMGATAGGPRIKFSEEVHNFGKVKSSDVLRHDFIVTNVGDAPLEITKVEPACGCTFAGTWDRRVQPGKTGKIPIEFSPAGFDGTVIKTIAVTCNDSVQPVRSLQIEATVWQPIEVQPPNLYFTPIEDETTAQTKVVRISSSLGQMLALEPPQVSNPSFKALLKTLEPGKQFELRVTYAPLDNNAAPQGAITIKTSSVDLPIIKLSANVMPQPALAVIPQQITLPAQRSEVARVHDQIVLNNSSVPMRVTEASVNAAGVTVEISEPKPGKLFMLRISFPPGFQVTRAPALELTIRTSLAKHPVITVPIEQGASPSA